MVDRVGAPYRVLLYQPGIRFIHLSNSKGLCLQQVEMTFSFSLYAVPLQITQIAYFRSETGDLESKESLEDSKVYCY